MTAAPHEREAERLREATELIEEWLKTTDYRQDVILARWPESLEARAIRWLATRVPYGVIPY